MTTADLDRLITHLRAADAASARGCPALAALHATVVRATMYRAGLRYGAAREVDAIDRAINRAMGTGAETMITDRQIRALAREARLAGDDTMVDICDRALRGDATARAECARVIAEAAAQT